MTARCASCQCGKLRVETSIDPDFVIACNCRACQRRTGAPFGVAAYFTRESIAVFGNSKQWSRTADSGRGLVNSFCPTCGTNLFWTLDMRPDHVGVAYGAFDTPLPDPVRAIWMEEKIDWVTFPESWPAYPKGTPEP